MPPRGIQAARWARRPQSPIASLRCGQGCWLPQRWEQRQPAGLLQSCTWWQHPHHARSDRTAHIRSHPCALGGTWGCHPPPSRRQPCTAIHPHTLSPHVTRWDGCGGAGNSKIRHLASRAARARTKIPRPKLPTTVSISILDTRAGARFRVSCRRIPVKRNHPSGAKRYHPTTGSMWPFLTPSPPGSTPSPRVARKPVCVASPVAGSCGGGRWRA